jgi:hypothetical protein
MAEHYFSTNIGNEITLCIAPLTNRRLAMSGQDIPDPSGYFLYETNKSENPNEVRVIAQIFSEEAAFQLSRILNME